MSVLSGKFRNFAAATTLALVATFASSANAHHGGPHVAPPPQHITATQSNEVSPTGVVARPPQVALASNSTHGRDCLALDTVSEKRACFQAKASGAREQLAQVVTRRTEYGQFLDERSRVLDERSAALNERSAEIDRELRENRRQQKIISEKASQDPPGWRHPEL